MAWSYRFGLLETDVDDRAHLIHAVANGDENLLAKIENDVLTSEASNDADNWSTAIIDHDRVVSGWYIQEAIRAARVSVGVYARRYDIAGDPCWAEDHVDTSRLATKRPAAGQLAKDISWPCRRRRWRQSR